MAHVFTALLFIAPISAVFGIVYSDKRIYNAVDDILTRFFENLD